jgi:hypothetical protein
MRAFLPGGPKGHKCDPPKPVDELHIAKATAEENMEGYSSAIE